MRCFYACFIAGEPKRKRHLMNAKPPSKELKYQPRETLQLLFNEEPIKVNKEYKDKKLEEELMSCQGRKKVTFNLSVENNEASTSSKEEVAEREKDAKEEKDIESTMIVNSIGSVCHPHRHQTCANGEEYEGLDLEDSESESIIQEESSESLFSLSIDSRKQSWGGAELGEKEVTSSVPKCGSPSNVLEETGSNRNARNGSQNVDCVLSQIENLVQLKPVKTRAVLPFQCEDKENIIVEQCVDPNVVKLLARYSKANAYKEELVDQEVALDTTLSSRLVGSETTPMSNTSPHSIGNSPSGKRNLLTNAGDKPIIGVMDLTEETKQGCGSNSLGPSRSQSPVELIVIGTVGSYWRHTGQMVDSDLGSSGQEVTRSRSKIGEVEREEWNSTQFEAKLSAALEVGIAHVV